MNEKDIFNKVKMKIAISNVNEEDIVMKKQKKILVKTMGVAACTILSMTGIVFATTHIINKFGANSSDGVQIAVDNNYYAEVNTEYKTANGISASIDSFLIDDNNFDLSVNLKFDKILSNKCSIDIMDLKVINENNKLVFATKELQSEEMQKLYKTEQEAKEKYDRYDGAYSVTSERINDNEIKTYITATGNPVEFPTSQKLNITFNKIRYSYFENEQEKFIIYEGEWNYDIDVPSKMAKSNITNYKLVSISDENYKFESAKVSNTAFKIYLINCNGIAWNDNECVETSDGQKFYPAHKSDGDGEISVKADGIVRYYQTFNLTNYDATDTLKVHTFKSNGEEVIIELVKEK